MPQGIAFGLGSALDNNFQRIAAPLDEMYDVHWLFPGTGIVSGSTFAIYLLGGATAVPAVNLPNAADTGYLWSIPVRKEWLKHNAKLTIYGTSSAASTANYTLGATLVALPNTGNLFTGLRSVGNASGAVAGPAAIDDLVTSTLTMNVAPISIQTDFMLALYAYRTGSTDANANDFKLLAVRLEAYRA